MRKLLSFLIAISPAAAVATCTQQQLDSSATLAAAGSYLACTQIYAANANKQSLCLSTSGAAITVAQAIAAGQTK